MTWICSSSTSQGSSVVLPSKCLAVLCSPPSRRFTAIWQHIVDTGLVLKVLVFGQQLFLAIVWSPVLSPHLGINRTEWPGRLLVLICPIDSYILHVLSRCAFLPLTQVTQNVLSKCSSCGSAQLLFASAWSIAWSITLSWSIVLSWPSWLHCRGLV